MTLPNAAAAIIDLEKVQDYLLNEAHPDNGGKARFFLALGFRRDDPQAMCDAFRQAAQILPIRSSIESPHGVKYLLEGPIQTPSGKTPSVRMVWIVDRGQPAPRLVTAYPIEPAKG